MDNRQINPIMKSFWRRSAPASERAWTDNAPSDSSGAILGSILPALVAGLLSIATALIVAWGYSQTLQAETAILDRRLDTHASVLQQHLVARERLVTAVAATFRPDSRHDPAALAGIDEPVLRDVADAFSFVWIVSARRSEVPQMLSAAQNAGWEQPQVERLAGALSSQEEADEAAIVFDIRPTTSVNRRSLGLNLLSLPAPAAALTKARATGKAAATAPLELVQTPGRLASVLYAPVLRAPGTAVTDFVGMSFQYDNLLQSSLAAAAAPAADFFVVDRDDSDGRVLYGANFMPESDVVLSRDIPFAGRVLSIHYKPHSPPRSVALRDALVIAGGMLSVTVLLSAAAVSIARANRRAHMALGAHAEAEGRLQVAVAELNHRAKNIFAIVSAMIRRTAQETPGFSAEELLGRIQVFASATGMLAENNWAGLHIRELIQNSLAKAAECEGDNILLTPAAAQGIALVLHELWTNAVKHGALAAGGAARVSWRTENEKFFLVWKETGGKRRSTAASARVGFGWQLITKLVPAQLNGDAKVDLSDDGLLYVFVGDARVIVGGPARAPNDRPHAYPPVIAQT